MKKTIAILVFSLGLLNVRGQNKTIPVMLMVSDTATHKIKHYAGELLGSTGEQTVTLAEDYTELFIDSTVFWIRGYEIITPSQENIWNINAAMLSIWNPPHPGFKHLSYLNQDKKPIKYFVWVCKEL